MKQILARAQEGRDSYEVNSTPTFFINGKKVQGAKPYEAFEKVLNDVQSQI